jgi:hypothetical protein
MNPWPQERSVLILDGASYHTAAALKPLHDLGALVYVLPAYEPWLMPQELAWAQLRRWLEKHGQGLELAGYSLRSAIQAGLLAITAATCARYFRKCGYRSLKPPSA